MLTRVRTKSFHIRHVQSDAYQATGCYNLLCSGFIQTNSRIAIGAAISPLSEFEGSQFDVTIVIWKVTFYNIFTNNISKRIIFY